MTDPVEITMRSFSPELTMAELCRPVGGREVSQELANRTASYAIGNDGKSQTKTVGALSVGHSALKAVRNANKAIKAKRKTTSRRLG